MITAIVLAAGTSTRMGEVNKLLLPFNNKSIVSTTVGNIIDSGIKEVIVVTGHERELIEQELEGYKVVFITNEEYVEGMTTSIKKGVSIANGNGYMICLADMIKITSKEYLFLQKYFEELVVQNPKTICLPVYNNLRGNPVIFSAYYKSLILQHKELDGCKEIVKNNNEHLALVSMTTDHVLFDIDNKEEYENIQHE